MIGSWFMPLALLHEHRILLTTDGVVKLADADHPGARIKSKAHLLQKELRYASKSSNIVNPLMNPNS